ncbi:MAG: hypothetical protein AB4058_07600 [Microcystaceae cyanobacterium]
MQSALNQFRISIRSVRDLISLYHTINAQSTRILNASLEDILRSALVLTVSALDYYIHEVVILGMLEIYQGNRPETPISANTTKSSFARFQISLDTARQDRITAINIASWLEQEIQRTQSDDFIQNTHTISSLSPIIADIIQNKLNQNINWLENEIREKLSYQSFQQPTKIADAIRLISDKRLWDEVGNLMGKPAKDIKQQLTAIVDRVLQDKLC